MNNKRWKIAAAAACSGALVALIAQAADLVKPNMRLGLWEMTSTGKASGAPPIPEDALARLPPEKRAQLMASIQAAAGRPMVIRQCMTADKLAQGLQVSDRPNCTRTVLTSTPSEMNVREECTSQGGTHIQVMAHFFFSGGDHATGTINMAMSGANGQSMTTERTMEAKWLGADCGGIKDAQIVR